MLQGLKTLKENDALGPIDHPNMPNRACMLVDDLAWYLANKCSYNHEYYRTIAGMGSVSILCAGAFIEYDGEAIAEDA